MTSTIAGTLAQLFGYKIDDEFRVLFLGLDASGRTATLYRLRLGENITTIPTIGFNIEDINVQGMKLTIWDVGGCDKIRPLWRHYFQDTDGVVFFVDSNDRDRMPEVAEELKRLRSESELQGRPILVLANKQDLPSSMAIDEACSSLGLEDAFGSTPWNILPYVSFDGDLKPFIWLVDAMAQQRKAGTFTSVSTSKKDKSSEAEKNTSKESPEETLTRWLEQEDIPNDDFLKQVDDYSLDSWDHRTHLRLAWLLLTRHGRREGLARIFSMIKAFIENSPRTSGRTFHETMTYFFSHMVHYAVTVTKNPKGDFKTFLLLNPQFVNSGMFLHYYSKKLMLETPEARTSVVLPDKRPLPSLLSDVSGKAVTQPTSAPLASLPMLDDEFMRRYKEGSLSNWGHDQMLHLLYSHLRMEGRKRAVDAAFEDLRKLQKEAFSATITYFWIQMLTAVLASEYYSAVMHGSNSSSSTSGKVEDANDWKGGVLPDFHVLLDGSGYTSVKLQELVKDQQMYLKYFSKALIYSKDADEGFVLPDKKPLPNVMQ